jgi:hypothetical protein
LRLRERRNLGGDGAGIKSVALYNDAFSNGPFTASTATPAPLHQCRRSNLRNMATPGETLPACRYALVWLW